MNNYDSLHKQFRASSGNITQMIQEEGLLLRPYSHASLPYFSLLPANEQFEVLENVKLYEDICAEVKASGGSLKDNRLMTETALKQCSWEARPEDLDLIDSDHLIEIYSNKHVQVFRSFNFFAHTSYTFEDLCCRKWYHLYERSADDHAAVVAVAHDFYNQSYPSKMVVTLPEQCIQEKDTLERLTCFSRIEYLLPVFQNTQLIGMMVLIHSRIQG